MNNIVVNSFFISEKISKVRWVPEELRESDQFLSGSWDMRKNFVRAWQLQRNQCLGDQNEYVPRCSGEVEMEGDVTGLEMVTENSAIVACSDGRLTLLKIKKGVEVDNLHMEAQSNVLHKFSTSGRSASCTSISVYGQEIASVGEDCSLNIIGTQGAQFRERRHIKADCCSLLAVHYINPEEVLTGNRLGVIRMFDIRSSASNVMSTAAFMISCEDTRRSNYVSCLTSHPTQSHIVFAGSEEGSITVWDLRNPGCPASYLTAHMSPITDIGFHRPDSSKLITAAEMGELWLWKQKAKGARGGEIFAGMESTEDNTIPWLNGERAKNRISVTSVISNIRKAINSFDSHGSRIVCGSDCEAFYIVDNVF